LGCAGASLDYFVLPPEWRRNPVKLLSLQREYHLQFILSFGLPLAFPQAAWRLARRQQDRFFELAKALSVQVLRFPVSLFAPLLWPAGLPRAVAGRWQARFTIAHLRELCDEAAAHGFTVAVDNHAELTFGPLLWMIDEAHRANLAPALNLGNAVAQGEDPYQTTDRLAARAAYVLLQDVQGAGVGARAVPFGEGRIEMLEILRLLRRANYRGLLGVQVEAPSGGAAREDAWVEQSVAHLLAQRDLLAKESAA
jgi:sugar phosphate isomerase/epimerase